MNAAAIDHRRRSLTGALLGSLALALGAAPRVRPASAPARVIIVGAGFGGATVARVLRSLSPTTQISLFERRANFYTGPFSNLVLAGLRSPQSIERRLAAIGSAHRVQTWRSGVSRVDPVARRVYTEDGRSYAADCIVVAPGIAMRWDLIDGLDAARSDQMPHAWLGDRQLLNLTARLARVANGATLVIGAPPNPYRCPPGPYERASLFAYALTSTGRRRCKILIADAKDDFSKSALFKLEWDTLYPGMIEWVPRAGGGEVIRVDTARRQVWLKNSGSPVKAELASIVPAQRAADLAQDSDLTDESGWCPVHPETFESLRHPGIYIVGDAAIAAPIPKSAFAANSEAKLCAAAIAAALNGSALPEPKLLNTCYSMVADHAAISVSGYYAAVNGRMSALSEATSPLSGGSELRAREARQARAWYANITADSFGSTA